MNNFKDFGIKSTSQAFRGPAIEIYKVLNKEIVIEKFKVEPSKKKAGTEYLTLQIHVDNQDKVIFVGSKNLIDLIKQVATDKFPFKTIIIKENDRLEFT